MAIDDRLYRFFQPDPSLPRYVQRETLPPEFQKTPPLFSVSKTSDALLRKSSTAATSLALFNAGRVFNKGWQGRLGPHRFGPFNVFQSRSNYLQRSLAPATVGDRLRNMFTLNILGPAAKFAVPRQLPDSMLVGKGDTRFIDFDPSGGMSKMYGGAPDSIITRGQVKNRIEALKGYKEKIDKFAPSAKNIRKSTDKLIQTNTTIKEYRSDFTARGFTETDSKTISKFNNQINKLMSKDPNHPDLARARKAKRSHLRNMANKDRRFTEVKRLSKLKNKHVFNMIDARDTTQRLGLPEVEFDISKTTAKKMKRASKKLDLNIKKLRKMSRRGMTAGQLPRVTGGGAVGGLYTYGMLKEFGLPTPIAAIGGTLTAIGLSTGEGPYSLLNKMGLVGEETDTLLQSMLYGDTPIWKDIRKGDEYRLKRMEELITRTEKRVEKPREIYRNQLKYDATKDFISEQKARIDQTTSNIYAQKTSLASERTTLRKLEDKLYTHPEGDAKKSLVKKIEKQRAVIGKREKVINELEKQQAVGTRAIGKAEKMLPQQQLQIDRQMSELFTSERTKFEAKRTAIKKAMPEFKSVRSDFLATDNKIKYLTNKQDQLRNVLPKITDPEHLADVKNQLDNLPKQIANEKAKRTTLKSKLSSYKAIAKEFGDEGMITQVDEMETALLSKYSEEAADEVVKKRIKRRMSKGGSAKYNRKEAIKNKHLESLKETYARKRALLDKTDDPLKALDEYTKRIDLSIGTSSRLKKILADKTIWTRLGVTKGFNTDDIYAFASEFNKVYKQPGLLRQLITKGRTNDKAWTQAMNKLSFASEKMIGVQGANKKYAVSRLLKETTRLGDDVETVFKTHTITAMNSMKIARLGVVAGLAITVLPMAVDAVKKGTRYVDEKLNKLNMTLNSLNTQEFGGKIYDDQRANTHRQAAIQAIQSSLLSARNIMGQEGKYMHPTMH